MLICLVGIWARPWHRVKIFLPLPDFQVFNPRSSSSFLSDGKTLGFSSTVAQTKKTSFTHPKTGSHLTLNCDFFPWKKFQFNIFTSLHYIFLTWSFVLKKSKVCELLLPFWINQKLKTHLPWQKWTISMAISDDYTSGSPYTTSQW